MATQTSSERELIDRAMAGDTPALEQLLLGHYDRLLQHITHRIPTSVRSVVSAEDILQQAYLRAFRAIGDFKPQTEHSLYGWLRVIADRQLMDACRGAKRENRSPLPAHSPGVAGGGDDQSSIRGLLSVIIEPDAGAPNHAMVDEMTRALQVAIAGLPDNYREMIRLRYLEGYPMEEVALQLNLTDGAARGLCRRARQQIREELNRLSRFI